MTLDTGYEALTRLLAEEGKTKDTSAPRNEAQTRFDLIDRVLKEVLQWPAAAIRVEHSVENGFTDYELVDTGTLAVVEAKREGVAFTLPQTSGGGIVSLRPLLHGRAKWRLEVRDAAGDWVRQFPRGCAMPRDKW